jgi:hypothetical protein
MMENQGEDRGGAGEELIFRAETDGAGTSAARTAYNGTRFPPNEKEWRFLP